MATVGDFNGNATSDLATANFGYNSIGVQLGLSDSLSPPNTTKIWVSNAVMLN